MPRSPRRKLRPVGGGSARPTGAEVLNILYPRQLASSKLTAERYAVHSRALPAHHVAHWVYGDAAARRRFARACAPARLHFVVTGRRAPVQAHNADLCVACRSART